MKSVNGIIFPRTDVHCAPAMFSTVGDLETFYKYVNKFDVAVQAGGNVGMFPAKMAEKFKTVYTFEPDAINFNCMAKNVMNLNVIKFQAALGERHKLIELERNPENIGAHYIKGCGAIPTLRIDDLELLDCDFLMLDVEGSEIDALNGGIGTIMQHHPCIVVEDKGHQTRYGYADGDIAKLLGSIGYHEVDRVHRDVVYVCK